MLHNKISGKIGLEQNAGAKIVEEENSSLKEKLEHTRCGKELPLMSKPTIEGNKAEEQGELEA